MSGQTAPERENLFKRSHGWASWLTTMAGALGVCGSGCAAVAHYAGWSLPFLPAANSEEPQTSRATQTVTNIYTINNNVGGTLRQPTPAPTRKPESIPELAVDEPQRPMQRVASVEQRKPKQHVSLQMHAVPSDEPAARARPPRLVMEDVPTG